MKLESLGIDEECGLQIERFWKLKNTHAYAWEKVQYLLLSNCGRGLERWRAQKNKEQEDLIMIKSEQLKSLQDKEDATVQREIKRLHTELGVLLGQEDIK